MEHRSDGNTGHAAPGAPIRRDHVECSAWRPLSAYVRMLPGQYYWPIEGPLSHGPPAAPVQAIGTLGLPGIGAVCHRIADDGTGMIPPMRLSSAGARLAQAGAAANNLK